MEGFIVKRRNEKEWLVYFKDRLQDYTAATKNDPQANPVKSLAYDISKHVETRELAFRDIESIVKIISDDGAIKRAKRLRTRAGVDKFDRLFEEFEALLDEKAREGFSKFKAWVEHTGQGVVLTAHPTFSLSKDVYNVLGKITSSDDGTELQQISHLKALKYLRSGAPTLREEHEETQAALARIQTGLDHLNFRIFEKAKAHFPEYWTSLTPCLMKIYSWVGYDIDGRTDIGWGDAIRLRLQEKRTQLQAYLNKTKAVKKDTSYNKDARDAISEIITRLKNALESTDHDLELFRKDLTVPANLVAAANQLTRKSERRLRSTKLLYPLIQRAVTGAKSEQAKLDMLMLRAKLRCFGLGTARIHFRLNSRHVMAALRPDFGLKRADAQDERTLSRKISAKIETTQSISVNFASLALEKNTARRQMILIAQIHKYIDNETPIRMLIAECEDSIVPLGMLYLARNYGLENHIDISPLFETRKALNTAGRIIGKMLDHKSYRDYVRTRGVIAIQTGFSDAGRFMGQLPATLAIERLQSHMARVLDKKGLHEVTAIIFNTHGESMGRGGHPGTIENRQNYVMSPWAMRQFEKRRVPFCHETSFQGGDGFLWFQTETLTSASLLSMVSARHRAHESADHDRFYKERDFSWDIYRTLSAEQEHLYASPDYINTLGPFAQNFLVPTGSRAVIRAGTKSAKDPRSLRAIPHNAILQQFCIPANTYFGLGRASRIDTERFQELLKTSDRAKLIFDLALTALARSDSYILTAYARLFDPGFWLGRALLGSEKYLNEAFQTIAETLMDNPHRARIVDLANLLRLDQVQLCEKTSKLSGLALENQRILTALRIAVLMKMHILAASLPQFARAGLSNLDILRRLQDHDVDQIIIDLKAQYPEIGADTSWTKDLAEKTTHPAPTHEGFPHLVETTIKPLARAAQLTRQITIAMTHNFDAFG